MTDELDLGPRLTQVLDDLSPSKALPDRIASRVAQRERQRRAVRAGGSVLAMVVLVVGVLSLIRGDGDNAVVTDGSSAPFRWETLPGAPVPPRANSSAVWTGSEVVVWGGSSPSSSREGVRGDGAAYEPTTGRWRLLPEAPIARRSLADTVWTGTEMIVWGGWRPEGEGPAGYVDGAAYDPVRNTWRRIPDAPIDGRVGTGVAWTGKEMVVVGGVPTGGPGSDTIGAAYDPVRNTWRLLPDLGFDTQTGARAIWTGEEVLYWRAGGQLLFAYDPDADVWARRTSPIDEFRLTWSSAPLVWTGTDLVVTSVSYPDGDEEWATAEAIAYDPRTDDWRRVVRTPNVENRLASIIGPAATWTGRELVAIDAVGSSASALEPRTGRWYALPSPPQGLLEPTVIATDDGEVYVFGSETNARLTRRAGRS